MKECNISFEVAMLLKRRGFRELSKCYYFIDEENTNEKIGIISENDDEYDYNSTLNGFTVITQSLAQKWIREKLFQHIEIYADNIDKYYWTTCDLKYHSSIIKESERSIYQKNIIKHMKKH